MAEVAVECAVKEPSNGSAISDSAVTSEVESIITVVKEEPNDGNSQNNQNDCKSSNTEDESKKSDLFAYLDRSDFTSEKFKIQIRGLPKYYGIGELKKLLSKKLKLNPSKIKPPKKVRFNVGSPWLYVCFRSEEDKNKAITVLDGFKWKNKELSAEPAEAAPDPLVKRRMQDQNSDDCKRRKLEFKSQEEALKHNVTPCWNVPYEEQLKDKEERAKAILKTVGQLLSKENPDLSDYLKGQAEKFDGLPCEFQSIIASPENIEGYRNKCEFSIGLDENKKKTVGFRLGTYAQGTIVVAPIPEDLLNVPQRMKEAVWKFQNYVQQSSFDVYNPETHLGYWRQLTIRMGFVTNEIMLIVSIHPQNLTPEELQDIKNDLVDYFTNREGKETNPSSIYFQCLLRKQFDKVKAPVEHIFGKKFIVEKLCGLTFQISPEAFFQVNTAAANLLYKAVADLATVNKSTTLLDVCCGTGTIGLSLAENAGQVLGVDILDSAIADAQNNAEQNKITNCQFFAGQAESILTSVITRSQFDDIVAVVDPPRAGLHHKAVSMLRSTAKLNKLVFLSCNPSAGVNNFVGLGRPSSKTLPGAPFVPVKAVAVDMFPHTTHYELILYFERYSGKKTD